MTLSLGVGEIIAILGAIVGLAWALLKLTLAQFEKRLETKFASLDALMLDVKKLELEQIRRDGQYAILFVTKEELLRHQEKTEKTVERIFALLTTMNDKLDSKVSHDECERAMLRKVERQ